MRVAILTLLLVFSSASHAKNFGDRVVACIVEKQSAVNPEEVMPSFEVLSGACEKIIQNSVDKEEKINKNKYLEAAKEKMAQERLDSDNVNKYLNYKEQEKLTPAYSDDENIYIQAIELIMKGGVEKIEVDSDYEKNIEKINKKRKVAIWMLVSILIPILIILFVFRKKTASTLLAIKAPITDLALFFAIPMLTMGNLSSALLAATLSADIAYLASMLIFGEWFKYSFKSRASIFAATYLFACIYWVSLSSAEIASGTGEGNILAMLFGVVVAVAISRKQILKQQNS